MARGKRQLTALLPERHEEPDLFLCDILDATPKGDRASMEHPLFSLSVKKDMTPFQYPCEGEPILKVTPAEGEGRANIFDRDILIYILSQLMAAKKDGRPIARRVRVCAHDLLRATNRHTSGQAYATLKRALTRLQFTRIETNLHDHGFGQWRQISFITDASIIKEDASGRMLDVEIELGGWLVKAIESNNMLTLSRRYFRLRKPLERRLYELARKHCGNQKEWRCGLDKLQEKCGSSSTSKEFKRLIKAIIETDEEDDHMPDYRFSLAADILTVTPKPEFTDVYAPADQGSLPFLAALSPGAYQQAREAAPGWDVYGLEQRWREWMSKDGRSAPRAPDAAFVGFCRSYFERNGRPH